MSNTGKSTMQGKGEVRFSTLFADSLATFGYQWCIDYYVNHHGMPKWEFEFWLKIGVMENMRNNVVMVDTLN